MAATMPSEYSQRRQKLATAIGADAIAVFTSLYPMPGSGDYIYPYRQDANMLYLCGIDQPDTQLVIRGCTADTQHEEFIFLRSVDPQRSTWEGDDISPAEVENKFGFKQIKALNEFFPTLQNLALESQKIFLSNNEHSRSHSPVTTAQQELITRLRTAFPLHIFARVDPLLHRQRMIKTPAEIDQIRTAIDITRDSLLSAWPKLAACTSEYELEATIAYEIRRRGSPGFAFQPIVAAGANSCILHYTRNNRHWQDGEIVLIDIGAIYGDYSSDITRVVPVAKKFTPRQLDVYKAVLATQRYAADIIRPRATITDIRKQTTLFLAEQLKKLKLIHFSAHTDQTTVIDLCKPYFMHGIGHSLGIDVHDSHPNDATYTNNMVMTIEPGIYISDEGIGIRLEDDFLIGDEKNENLSARIPIEAIDIEHACSG